MNRLSESTRAPHLRRLFFVIAGVVVAVMASVAVATRPYDSLGLVVASVLGAVGVLLARRLDRQNAAVLVHVFVVAFLVRVIAVYVLHYLFFLRDPTILAGDDLGYDQIGAQFAAYWHGTGFSAPTGWLDYRYFVGALSYLAPGFLLLPRLINAFAGALTAALAASAAATLFGRRSGRITGLLTAFWPSIVVWSSLNLKDVWAMLALSLLAYVVARRATISHTKMALGLLVVFAILAVIRPWEIAVVGAGLTLGFARTVSRGPVLALVSVATVIGAAILFPVLGAGTTELQTVSTTNVGEIRLSTMHGGSSFDQGIDVSGPGAAITSAPMALAIVVLGPFPFALAGLRELLTIPEVLALYLLLPSAWRGIRRGIRERANSSWPLLAVVGAVLLSLALLEGNLGLIYRHRSQAFVLLFIFIGAGWRESRGMKTSREDAVRLPPADTAQPGRWEQVLTPLRDSST
jgi:hypothetical protein